MSNQNRAPWTVKEIITTLLLSLLCVAVCMGGAMITMVNPYTAMYLSGGVGVFLAAPVYMLLERRVDRFGTFTTLMLIMSSLFLARSLVFTIMIPFYVVVGFGIEWLFLRRPQDRRSVKNLSINWVVFSVLYLLSTYIPMLVQADAYIQEYQSQGMSQEFINAFISTYTNPVLAGVIVIITALCAFGGTLVGSKMLRKHFERSGAL